MPVSTGTPLTKKFASASENWIFRVSPRDEIQAPFIVADALKRGFRKVALFADTSGYGEAGKNDVEKALAEAGLKPVSVQRFAVGVKDLSNEVASAKAAGADVVISYTVGPEAAVLAANVGPLGPTPWEFECKTLLRCSRKSARMRVWAVVNTGLTRSTRAES